MRPSAQPMPSKKASCIQRVFAWPTTARQWQTSATQGFASAIATPLSLGADLGDGGYLALMELRPKHAKAFAEQLGPCGEIAFTCVVSILGWSAGQPPTCSERRFRDRPRELLPATLSEGAWVPKQFRRVAAATKKLITESCADRLVVGPAVGRDAES